jgi:cob(I)alamin adenosyltransferase
MSYNIDQLEVLASELFKLAQDMRQGKKPCLEGPAQQKFFDAVATVIDKHCLELRKAELVHDDNIDFLTAEIDTLNERLEAREKEINILSGDGYFFK